MLGCSPARKAFFSDLRDPLDMKKIFYPDQFRGQGASSIPSWGRGL